MKRAKQLDSVEFALNTLFIQEELTNAETMGEMNMSADGTHIVYVAEIKTPYITLDSKQYGWITETQRLALVAMRKQLGSTFLLTYDDLTTDTVRFAHEKEMVFTPLFEGSKKYTAIIPLAKA